MIILKYMLEHSSRFLYSFVDLLLRDIITYEINELMLAWKYRENSIKKCEFGRKIAKHKKTM